MPDSPPRAPGPTRRTRDEVTRPVIEMVDPEPTQLLKTHPTDSRRRLAGIALGLVLLGLGAGLVVGRLLGLL